MKIAIGCDPNAASMKNAIIDLISERGLDVKDFGSDDPVYANTAISVAEAVAGGDYDAGIVLCGTGIGVSIAANKVKGAYCALVSDVYQAERAVLSNNANMIALGEQVTGLVTAKQMVATWLDNLGKFDPAGRSGAKVDRYHEYDSTRK